MWVFLKYFIRIITDLEVILAPAQFQSLTLGFSAISNHYLQCCFLLGSAKMEKITKKYNFTDSPAFSASYKEHTLTH